MKWLVHALAWQIDPDRVLHTYLARPSGGGAGKGTDVYEGEDVADAAKGLAAFIRISDPDAKFEATMNPFPGAKTWAAFLDTSEFVRHMKAA